MNNDTNAALDRLELHTNVLYEFSLEVERLQKRLEYIRENLSDPVAVNFALNASDEEIDALE